MPPQYTTPSDVFSPQRVGQAILGYQNNNLALMANGFVTEIPGAIWQPGGKQITFPRIKGFSTGSVANPSDGSQVDSDKVEMDMVTADAVSRIKSVAVDKVTLEYCLQEMQLSNGTNTTLFDSIMTQLGQMMLDELDKAMVAEAETTTLAVGTTGVPVTVSYDQVVNGLALWGDKAARADAALVVHSNTYKQILKLSDLKDAAKFGAPTMLTGQVVYLAGLPVYVSDNITQTTVGEVVSYTNLIVRRGALRYSMRSEMDVEIKTEPRNTMRYLDADWRYLVDLEQGPRLGVVKLITSHAA